MLNFLFFFKFNIDISTYLDFLNGLKEKRNPNATQISGVYVRFINDNKASTQNNLDQNSRGSFISQLKNYDVRA